MKFLTLIIGIPTSILLFVIYWIFLKFGFDPLLVRTFIFAAFGSYSLFLIFSVRSLRKSIFSYNPFSNLYLIAGVIFGLGLITLAVYWPPLQKLFGTMALPPIWVAGVIGVGILNITAIELGKLLIRRRKLNGR